jgi:prolyl 4-hydroxylase
MTILPNSVTKTKVSRKGAIARFIRRVKRTSARTRYIAVIAASILLFCYIFLLRGSSPAPEIEPIPIVKAVDDVPPIVESYNPEKDMTILSWSPRVFLYHNFLTPEECQKIIDMGKDHLVRSQVVGKNASKTIEDRSSYGAWIPYEDSEWIDKKISAVTHMPVESMEQLHLLRYNPTQQYKPHYDWFRRDLSEDQERTIVERGQRLATFITYLNEVEEGGETIFPKINLKVKPKRGEGLLFYNLLPHGETDSNALHGGLPVIKGEKFIVTKWIREKKWH